MTDRGPTVPRENPLSTPADGSESFPYMPRPRRRRASVIAAAAVLAASAATAGWAVGHSGRRVEVPAQDLCYTPEVAKTFAGDPTATSPRPRDWKTGVLLSIKSPHQQDYSAVRIGYRDPHASLVDTKWSMPIPADELEGTSAFMRTGHDAYTITVEGIAPYGSTACGDEPVVTSQETTPKAATDGGAIQPDF